MKQLPFFFQSAFDSPVLRRTMQLVLFTSLLGLANAQTSSDYAPTTKQVGEYTAKVYPNDPLNMHEFTLDNGLKVRLSVNRAKPRVYAAIAAAVGSKHDPADKTGLAHYLEHLLFKGTKHFGTLDYRKEQQYLEQISSLYEKRAATDDSAKRKAIYDEIDSIATLAAENAIPNEYDKFMTEFGAKGTNAFTGDEQTVYINNIPANMLERFLKVEGNRFDEPVFRLFHTELETVYEEKNRSIDQDVRRAQEKLRAAMFEKHTYGTQTTLGKIEHLKNPSIKRIRQFFETYYVPNNMCITLSGDLDIQRTIELVDKYFGRLQRRQVPDFQVPDEKPIDGPKKLEVTGPNPQMVNIAYRLPGRDHPDHMPLMLASQMLYNGEVGLIDLNLNQEQLMLRSLAFLRPANDYSGLILYGIPTFGKSLEEGEQMLLDQVAKLQEGDFDASLLDAVVRNQKISEIRQNESNRNRALQLAMNFTYNESYADHLARFERMEQVSKEDIVRVANKYLKKDRAVVLHKKQGPNPELPNVEKPDITGLDINRDKRSEFAKEVNAIPTTTLEPDFIDYEEEIHKEMLQEGIEYLHYPNTENERFRLEIRVQAGDRHDKELALAVRYLEFLGTDDRTAEEFKKEFFKLGCNYSVYTTEYYSAVRLSGLQESFKPALKLLLELLNDPKADQEAYDNLVMKIRKERDELKSQKQVILFQAMSNYATYGAENPFTDRIPLDKLKEIDPKTLTQRIQSMLDYSQIISYYGPAGAPEARKAITATMEFPAEPKPLPEEKEYTRRQQNDTKVYFVEYDMVQAQVLWLNHQTEYNEELLPQGRLFNEYFGGSMSSIVFQEMRESKGLAYTASSRFNTPSQPDDPFMLFAYVGTQADKLGTATETMTGLMQEQLIESETSLEGAKEAVTNQIRSERIIRERVLTRYLRDRRMGHADRDIRREIYQKTADMGLQDVKQFHEQYIKGRPFDILVIGKEDRVDLDMLKEFGEVKKLSLEKVFGY